MKGRIVNILCFRSADCNPFDSQAHSFGCRYYHQIGPHDDGCSDGKLFEIRGNNQTREGVPRSASFTEDEMKMSVR